MNKFYMVSFDDDGSMRFFQNLEMAKDYVWYRYIKTFPNTDTDTYNYDRNMLNFHSMVEDFAWIDTCEFEDDKFAKEANID